VDVLIVGALVVVALIVVAAWRYLPALAGGVSRRKIVRVHFLDAPQSLEGVLVARTADHYRIAAPKMLEAEGQTMLLDGEIEVPRERVLMVQVLAKGA
jgi:hypothetical protein